MRLRIGNPGNVYAGGLMGLSATRGVSKVGNIWRAAARRHSS
jgi:hypothetical protein